MSRTEGHTSNTNAVGRVPLRSTTKHHQRWPLSLQAKKYSAGGESTNGIAKTISLGNQCSTSSARYTTSIPKHLTTDNPAPAVSGLRPLSQAKLAGSWMR